MSIAFLAIRAWEIRAAKRARSSAMEDGEGISGAGDEIIRIGGERGVLRIDGEGEDLMPLVRDGFRIAGIED